MTKIISYIAELISIAKADINKTLNLNELKNIRIKFLGKKGLLTLQIANLRKLQSKNIAFVANVINKAKKEIELELCNRKSQLEKSKINYQLSTESIDISLPGRRTENGSMHPITCTINRIEEFFTQLGFSVIYGKEIEDDYHNFDALNIPMYHPARSYHDTFWFDAKRLLRTQTSSIQIHVMNNQNPPIRLISSGRVYRRDYDQTHTPMFHQAEGLILDQCVTFVDLKSTLNNFLYYFFERNLQTRFRPSYFPFTEPSVEIDIMNESGQWLEVIGSGMVHPNVLRNVNINPKLYSAFAFGIGVERLAMLRYNIVDLRLFFENDLRFLKQFK